MTCVYPPLKGEDGLLVYTLLEIDLLQITICTYLHTEAEKLAEVAAIEFDRMIMEKKKQKEIADVENEAHRARTLNEADSEYYRIQKVAEANKVYV